MTRIKICGITNIDDAQAAVAAGADAIGFVFAPSPRQMTADKVAAIRSMLPTRITVVGVFVAELPDEIMNVARICGLDLCQVHGDITPVHRQLLGQRLLPAITVHGKDPLEQARLFECGAVVLDALHPDRSSDTTIPFDWKLAQKVATEMNVILAGGLTIDNVASAIETVRPYGVDVSSGIEIRPGKKDHDKLSLFIQRIKACDSRIHAGISESSADDLFLKP